MSTLSEEQRNKRLDPGVLKQAITMGVRGGTLEERGSLIAEIIRFKKIKFRWKETTKKGNQRGRAKNVENLPSRTLLQEE